MIKVKIYKNKKLIFTSKYYQHYENKKFIKLDFDKLDCKNMECYDLSRCNLNGVNLFNSNLSSANLLGADLTNANLTNVIMYGVNLTNTKFDGANLDATKFDDRIRLGKINKEKEIVYKKCQNKIVTLEIPIGAIIFAVNGTKARTNVAKVIAIDDDTTKGLKICSDFDKNFIYEIGKIVRVKNFNMQYNIECARGIHFFYDKESAKNYASQRRA